MAKIVFLIIGMIPSFITLGQSNINIKEKSPEITVTDWIHNKPDNTSLEGRFIVLEFWATWCGPCIAAVPHLNDIQEKVNNENLLFISITDESVDKIKRTLERIEFNSIVVSDQSKKTQILFGDGKKGLGAYPMTVLIDDKGIIRWIGEPKYLTESTVLEFLDGDLEEKNYFRQEIPTNSPPPPQEKTPLMGLSSQGFMEMVKDKSLLYFFQMNISKGDDNSNITLGTNALLLSSLSVSDIYEKVLNAKIYIDSELDSVKYDLVYKNFRSNDASLQRLEKEILNTIGMEKTLEKKQITKYILSVEDKSLLRLTLESMFSSKSDAGDKIIFTGYSISNMIKEMEASTDREFEYTGSGDQLYDFVISIKNIEAIEESLRSYGLNWVLETNEVEVTNLIRIKK